MTRNKTLLMAWCANCHVEDDDIPDLITYSVAGADPDKVTEAILQHNAYQHGYRSMDVVLNKVGGAITTGPTNQESDS